MGMGIFRERGKIGVLTDAKRPQALSQAIADVPFSQLTLKEYKAIGVAQKLHQDKLG